ncbi:MAG: delta-lactam-biosynthetic de-N-acetylase [Syntrophomonadaceae bacterium]|nr:delta-lactam-biosynthetic de-N-acetylase [Syntrophomonadaceae bacterium]
MRKCKSCLYLVLLLSIIAAVTGCRSNTSAPSPTPPAQTEEPAQETPAPTTTPVAENPDSQPPAAAAKSWSWWFTRNTQHQIPAANQDTVQLIAENNAFYVIPNNNKKIYLTFDAGYELGYTAKILDILERQQVKAAFFITGQYIKTQPDLVKRMQSSGHLVCNHTWNHPDLATVSQETFNQEIKSLEQRFTELTGAPMDHYLRPPMGNYSENSLKWANELGYKTVFWSIAFMDWDPNKQPGAEFSYKHVLANIHPGAVILLHAISQSDTEALDRIISDLRAQGYVFSTFGH